MTAPVVVKRPAYLLGPLAAGAIVAVALGVYGKVHTPTGKALFPTPFPAVIAHGLLGCIFYGAFVAKILTLHSRRLPGWALPWVAGTLFTALVAVGLTSAGWYFATIGVPG